MTGKLAAAAIILGSMSPVYAGTVDTLDLASAFYFNQYPFSGDTGTYQYAQSVTADDGYWSDLAFRVFNDTLGGTFSVEIYGARMATLLYDISTANPYGSRTVTGFVPDAADLLYSSVLTHDGTGNMQFEVAPDLDVSVGSTYFVVLNSFLGDSGIEGSLTSSSVLTTYGIDEYPYGAFIFANGGADLYGGGEPISNTTAWVAQGVQYNQDIAFRAVFDSSPAPVPVPAGLPLLAGTLGVLGLVTRRRHG